MSEDTKTITTRINLPEQYWHKWDALCGHYKGRDKLMQIIDKAEMAGEIPGYPGRQKSDEKTIFDN